MAEPVFAPVIFFDLGDTLIFLGDSGQEQRFQDTLDTLQVLHNRGYRLGLLSNQEPGTTIDQVQVRLIHLGLSPYIETALITISSEVPGNVGKPNQPIFDLALQKAGHLFGSPKSIFVTETLSHVEAARSYGWRAILKSASGMCQPSDGECVSSLSGLLDTLPPLADLAGTNFDLAPPATLVDGLWAVPIDIQQITAKLSFDGSTSSGTGDATIVFQMGRKTGNPIFDLRQSITAAWLDDFPLPVERLAQHNFGGGLNAELRIIEAILPAGTTHTLRVTYTLGIPQSSTAGTYPPQITWSNGPRITFNFGFTDLRAGRYLEAWIPANLIFDQFELSLQLQLLNTPIPHTVITNGQVVPLGSNNWQIQFPARFTALSPLLELRAADTLTNATDTVALPVSGAIVSIEAWKLSTDPTNLTVAINNVRTYLTTNELSSGPYIHGNRFVVFFHPGGMEYEGGTTTDTSALQHETFHSWWARGLKPASQPDGWFDEAWTVYSAPGQVQSQSFNFSEPAIMLCPRNPWIRVTSSGAYLEGNRFWMGVAALIAPTSLKAWMREFYQQRFQRPVTTTEIEEFLVSRSGNTQLVDAFHQFVFGFENPDPGIDLWLHDDPSDPGDDFWSGRFWDSPDLWVRNANDDGIEHQPPAFDQDNWFYARVHNRGSEVAKHFVVTFNVKEFAGTQFSYPNDFLPCVAAAAGFNLAPGASTIVKAQWPKHLVPAVGTHPCLLTSVLTKSEHPTSNRQVWEHNNLAQKNLTVVNLPADAWIVLPFVVSNFLSSTDRVFHLEVIRDREHSNVKASLMHFDKNVFKRVRDLQLIPFENVPRKRSGDQNDQLDCGGHAATPMATLNLGTNGMLTSLEPDLLSKQFRRGIEVPFSAGVQSQIPIVIQRHEQLVFGLRVRVPRDAKEGAVIKFDLLQRDLKTKKVVGGIALKITVAESNPKASGLT
jgi:hypothetical protein